MYSPAADADRAEFSIVKHETELRSGTETVLIVEDEASLRELMSGVLQTNGYKVLKAANGVEGLRVFREFQKPIHLVISDLVMPKIGGSEMVSELSQRGTEAEILYVSGYTNDALQYRGILDTGNRIPFNALFSCVIKSESTHDPRRGLGKVEVEVAFILYLVLYETHRFRYPSWNLPGRVKIFHIL